VRVDLVVAVQMATALALGLERAGEALFAGTGELETGGGGIVLVVARLLARRLLEGRRSFEGRFFRVGERPALLALLDEGEGGGAHEFGLLALEPGEELLEHGLAVGVGSGGGEE
jgi:hypothetical protein